MRDHDSRIGLGLTTRSFGGSGDDLHTYQRQHAGADRRQVHLPLMTEPLRGLIRGSVTSHVKESPV